MHAMIEGNVALPLRTFSANYLLNLALLIYI